MEFFLLGSLLVCSAARAELRVPSGKQRVVLAVLLLHSNHVVSTDVLIEALWGSEPPPSARAAMRNYVKRLRRVLGGAGHDLIRSVPGGYLIRVAASDLDVTRFEALERAGREAAEAGDWDRAADLLRAGLSLWRGEPLEDVRSEWLAVRELPRLAELRLRALETRIDLDLRLGRHAEAIAELWRLTRVHPLRERLYRLLMRALCQDGRYGEALAAYQSARQVLISELGTSLARSFASCDLRILALDPSVSRTEHETQGSRRGHLVRNAWRFTAATAASAAAPHLCGRCAELTALRRIAVSRPTQACRRSSRSPARQASARPRSRCGGPTRWPCVFRTDSCTWICVATTRARQCRLLRYSPASCARSAFPNPGFPPIRPSALPVSVACSPDSGYWWC